MIALSCLAEAGVNDRSYEAVVRCGAMASQFQPVSTPTLRSQIAERLRHAILSTSLRQGEKIVERKLATQFATSLTAVREALIELESEGLVTKKPNAATYVTRLTKRSAEEIFAVRRLLEPAAVARAAEFAKPADIEVLERNYMDLLDAARAGNTERFIQTDFAFHRKIWQMSDNDCLQNTLRRLLLPYSAPERSGSRRAVRLTSRRMCNCICRCSKQFDVTIPKARSERSNRR